jgi:natural product precursor
MKKKISNKLTLEKRSVAVLTEENMADLQGGNSVYTGNTWRCASSWCSYNTSLATGNPVTCTK